MLYKAHLLSYLEYGALALYHATLTVLKRRDTERTRFLRDVGVDEIIGLTAVHLALLSARLDIAMLGVFQRTALGGRPDQFQDLFLPNPTHPMIFVDAHELLSPKCLPQV